MAVEIEVGRITAVDNHLGKVFEGVVTFVDYENLNDKTVVEVSIPLDKSLSFAEVETRVLEKARQQLKELVASF